jgi:hypothetical protein
MLETAFKRDGKSPANMKEIFCISLKNQTNLLMEVCIGFVYSASQNT